MAASAQQIIENALGDIAPAGPYAIVDYPNYGNPGDAAIWRGARRVLEKLTGRPPAHVSTLRHFDAARCRSAIAGGTVFFLGGGNFGSLYEKHHRLRLRALERIGDARVVLLPLSVAEKAGEAGERSLVERTGEVLRGCARLTVLARERKSQALLRDVYGIDSGLCPDTAHCLTPPAVEATADAVALLRRDGEALRGRRADAHVGGTADGGGGTGAFDWPDDASLRWINRIGKLAARAPSPRLRLAAFDLVADRKVDAACRLIGSGRVVSTDRLHGVILAALIGRRVIASENATGKVGSYVATWAELLPDVSFRSGAA